MSVSLTKGKTISLAKEAQDLGISLDKVAVGLGWDQNEHIGSSFDIDAWALALQGSKTGKTDLVYFGNLNGASNCIHHMGDNLTGAGEGDDEVINIQLSKLPEAYNHILVGVTIYKGRQKGQFFKDIDNTFARVFDATTGKEICKYADQFKTEFGNSTTILIGAFFKDANNQWQFSAIGKGEDLDSISGALAKYSNFSLNKETTGGKKTMAVSLSKGGKVSLAKVAADAGIQGGLKNITVGLGWDTNRYDGGAAFDLDAAAFMLGASGKVRNDEDFIFYNNKKGPGIEHTGDNRTGEGDGDDEQIKVDLSAIPADVEKVDFTVTIDQADTRNQNFGMVENAYIRIIDDATGTELIRYDLGEDFSVETAIVVAELYRHNGEWKFNAIGSGFAGGLAALCGNFGINVG